ncbi:MAG: isoprenylcysteine carboxylmethyltransferase family protein [Caulobacteraceae bacterium]|nr:isoprenylcysteine carboxylmethyltransferase family protein [Caulobacteraceae bacterium]
MRNVPPPLWALILLAATYGLSLVPGLSTLPIWPTRPAGLIVIVAALAILFGAMFQFRLANTQLTPNSPTNNALVSGGIFSITRNPMYLAMTLFCVGGALWFGRPVMLLAPVLMFSVANWVFIPFEEAKMRRQFGDAFDAYCKRVRRWI